MLTELSLYPQGSEGFRQDRNLGLRGFRKPFWLAGEEWRGETEIKGWKTSLKINAVIISGLWFPHLQNGQRVTVNAPP